MLNIGIGTCPHRPFPIYPFRIPSLYRIGFSRPRLLCGVCMSVDARHPAKYIPGSARRAWPSCTGPCTYGIWRSKQINRRIKLQLNLCFFFNHTHWDAQRHTLQPPQICAPMHANVVIRTHESLICNGRCRPATLVAAWIRRAPALPE